MSLRTDTLAAASEALDQAVAECTDAPIGTAMLFATSHHAKQLSDAFTLVRNKTNARAVFGGTGAGVIGPRGEMEQAPGLSIMLLSSERVTSGAALLPRLDSPDAGDLLRSELPSLYRERGTIFLLMDPKSLHPDFLSRIAAVVPETPVVGSAAAWCSPHRNATVAADGDALEQGAAVLHVAGCLEPLIGVAQAIVPGVPPRKISEAHDNVISRIDGDPAAEILAASVETIQAQSKTESLDIFCALAHSPADFETGRYMVRNILAVEPNSREVTIAERVRAGQYISFGQRNPKSARRSFKNMLERINRSLTGRAPRAAIIFNCVARGMSLYNRSNVDFNAFREFFPELPVAGIFGFAEVGPTYWENRKVRSSILNHTAVLVILTEPLEALGTS